MCSCRVGFDRVWLHGALVTRALFGAALWVTYLEVCSVQIGVDDRRSSLGMLDEVAPVVRGEFWFCLSKVEVVFLVRGLYFSNLRSGHASHRLSTCLGQFEVL